MLDYKKKNNNYDYFEHNWNHDYLENYFYENIVFYTFCNKKYKRIFYIIKFNTYSILIFLQKLTKLTICNILISWIKKWPVGAGTISKHFWHKMCLYSSSNPNCSYYRFSLTLLVPNVSNTVFDYCIRLCHLINIRWRRWRRW